MSDLHVRVILGMGVNGIITEVNWYDEFIRRDEAHKGKHNTDRSHYFSPLFEEHPGFIPVCITNASSIDLKGWLQAEYTKYGRYGDFGDILFVLRHNDVYILTRIVRKAYPKPSVASDLLPVLVDSHKKSFFIGILRGQEPGKGKPALIGGFNEVHGFNFYSSPKTLIAEGREEAGIRLELPASYGVTDTPFPEYFDVNCSLFGETIRSRAGLVGVFYTGNEEKNQSTGLKRVSFTAGYVLPIKIYKRLSKEAILEALVPEDKREGTTVVVYDLQHEEPEFGLSHHQTIYHAAVPMIMRSAQEL